jgi:hypothetical protein
MYKVKVTPVKGKAYEMYAEDYEQACGLYETTKQFGVEIKGVDGESFLYWPPAAVVAIELTKVEAE